MCLGADLHDIFPKRLLGHRQNPHAKKNFKKSSSRGHTNEQDQTSNAGMNEEIWGDGEGKGTNKALMASNRLRITLTHDSMLVISSLDIDVSSF